MKLKSILSLAMLMLIVSCSNKSGTESSSGDVVGGEEIARYMEVLVGVSGEDSASSNETNLLMEVYEGESAIQQIVFRNSTRTSIDFTGKITYESLTSPSIEITNGCDKVVGRLQSCVVELKYTPEASSASVLGSMTFGTEFSLNVELLNLGVKAPPSLEASGSLLISRESLDFGSLNQAESRMEILTLKNTTRGNLDLPAMLVDNAEFTVANHCPETLPRLASCRVEITYTAPESILLEESVSGLFSIGDMQTALAALKMPYLEGEEPSSCQPSANISLIGLSGDPKLVNLENQESLEVIVTNRNRRDAELCIELNELPSHFQVSGCESGIPRYNSCTLTFSKTNPPSNASHQVLINGEALLIQTGVEQVVACTLENATNLTLNNVLTVSGDVPSCFVQACSEGFQPSLDQLSCENSATEINGLFEIAHMDTTPPITPTFLTEQSSYSVPTHNIVVPTHSITEPSVPSTTVGIHSYITGIQTINPPELQTTLLPNGLGKYVYASTAPLVTLEYSYSEIMNNLLDGIFTTPDDPSYSILTKRHIISQVSNTSPQSEFNAGNDSPSGFILMNNELYFSSIDFGVNRKLFKLDTFGNITQLTNIQNGGNDNLVKWIAFNNEIYFIGAATTGIFKLFKVDTLGNVSQVANIRDGLNDNTSELIEFNNELYFNALTVSGHKLFKVNGLGNVVQVTNVRNGADDAISNLMIFNNELYFRSTNSSNFNKLFKLDANGVVSQVSNTRNGGSDNISNLMIFNNELYFRSTNSIGLSKLFKVDVLGNVSQVSNTGEDNHDAPLPLIVFNNELYFASQNSSGRSKLFKVDTLGNVSQVSNTRDGLADGPSQAMVFNNELYFRSSNSSGHTKLFKVDALGNVSQVSNTRSGTSDSNSSLTLFNNELYFSSVNNSGNSKLFKVDVLGNVSQVSNTNPSGSDVPTQLIVFNNELYFQGRDLNNRVKLFKLKIE